MSTSAEAVFAPQSPSERVDLDSLSAYSERIFGMLPRRDQRRWATVYLRCLLATPGHKSRRRMAGRLALPSSASQSLQQFITSSPWDWRSPRRQIAHLAAGLMPDAVWTTGVVLLPRGGTQSVGLQQHLVPESGRHINCQVGIALFLTDSRRSIPVDWKLMLNDSWCGDPERRSRAKIPREVTPRPAWALTLEMMAESARGQGAGSAPLLHGLGPSRHPDQLASQLSRAGRDFVIEVAPHQPFDVTREGSHDSARTTLRTSTAAGILQDRFREEPAAHGGGRRLRSALVRFPSPGAGRAAARPVHRLVAEIPAVRQRPCRFWVTSLRDAPPPAIHALAQRSALTDATVQCLRDNLGFLDFEGRSFPGWHHHMTLASAAYLYRCLGQAPQP
ncbi:IS701 family transposase [Streptomyces nitrosporeus]|uniref:IS701 family transposase n=1 Tax=Streptomyces nitrosporeus TaxID=28894 RepID=UPI0039A1882F